MEIRVLRYFLRIAREGSMTRAAKALYVSQPTLSKQMKELESELGKKLFKRHRTTLSLTDEGILLRKRAEDILDIVDKTTNEFKNLDNITGGDVEIGCAESFHISYLAQVIKEFKKQYPGFRFHLKSGDTNHVIEGLNRGFLDFAIIAEPPDLSKYNYMAIPEADVWGVLMQSNSPLAAKEKIKIDDLIGLPVFCSKQALKIDLPRWCGEEADKLNIIGTYTLFYNGSIFVKEGLGYMLVFDKLANTDVDDQLCFRPLEPTLETQMYIVWKKYQVFTPIADLLLKEFKKNF